MLLRTGNSSEKAKRSSSSVALKIPITSFSSSARFCRVFGCTRSLQLSRVACGLPLLQLAAGPFRLLPLHLGGQSSSGLTSRWRRLAPLFSLISESFGWRDGLDSSGWPAQPQAYVVVRSESAAGPPNQTLALHGGGPKLQRVLFNPPQVVWSARWPRLPLADRHGPTGSGSSQGCQHDRGSTRRWPICAKPFSSLFIRVVLRRSP